jgi:hypothetical protein
MTPALIAQINAIAIVCVTTEMSNTELLAVQRVDAWEVLESHLRPAADTIGGDA